MFDFFKSRQTLMHELLQRQDVPRTVKYRTSERTRFFFLDRNGFGWSVSSRLEFTPLENQHIPNNPNDPVLCADHTYHLVKTIRAAVAFLNLRGAGSNDVVKFYSNMDEKWYINKNSCDREGFISLFSNKQMQWVEIPERVIQYLEGGSADMGVERIHPYTLQICDYSNGMKPSKLKPLLTYEDTDDVTKAAYSALVDVPNMPGLKDHISRKVIFDLTVIDDSSLPVFDLKAVAEAIRDSEHEVDDWELNLNKVYVKFGKNPEPVRVMDLITSWPNHRFFCSDSPSRRRGEKYIKCDTIPNTYP